MDTKIIIKPNMPSSKDHFSLEKENVPHPLNYKTIMQFQQNKKSLIQITKSNKEYSIKHLHYADKKCSLICRKNKIVIPKLLEKQVRKWYMKASYHPGGTCSELFVVQYFY